ncbi:GTP-binding protein [Streptomyces sp. ME19-01-6]|nr:GTP-binding protein [Streptomyces sp. ME19-01-6]MDX3227918.1 GTP-binding protein [Streptomyces sp. ME19-01-6]
MEPVGDTEILRVVPGSIALHHDLTVPADGAVHRTVRDASGLLDRGDAPLGNDCACCALREDLVPELLRRGDGGGHRLAVVELWDSAEPQAMAAIIAAEGAPLVLTGVVTAVDPALVVPYLATRIPHGDRSRRRRRGRRAADDGDHALLAQLTPGARRVRTGEAALGAALMEGFDVAAAAARQHPACALLPQEREEHRGAHPRLAARAALPPGRLYAALEDLTCAAARSRGRFWPADRPDPLLSWDAAGGALCVESAKPWMAALREAAWEMAPAERRVAAAGPGRPRPRRPATPACSPTLDYKDNELLRRFISDGGALRPGICDGTVRPAPRG